MMANKKHHEKLMKKAMADRQMAAKIRVAGRATKGTEDNDLWDGPELASLKGNSGK